MPNYGSFEFAPKSFTRGQDIGRGQISVGNVDPSFFLELSLIKRHTHTGVDSLKLTAEAVPQNIRGFQTNERIERGVAAWTGGASDDGSLSVTFGVPFVTAPTILLTPADGSADYSVAVGSVTVTGCVFYWKDNTAATHTAVNINYLIIGR